MPTTPTSKFTKTGVKWAFELPATGSLCYDIDTQAQTADCTGAAWDVKVTSSGRTAALYTNSGPSSPDGSGKGAAQFRQIAPDLRLGLGLQRRGHLARAAEQLLGDAVDQVLDRALALRRAQVAAEVLRGDDVDRGLAPALGRFDVLLLEDGAAFAVSERGCAICRPRDGIPD